MSTSKGWIGVDLDGTLATYDHWLGIEHVGDPVPVMLERVKAWLEDGKDVRIFTARVGPRQDERDVSAAQQAIERWCERHVGRVLPVTATKDFGMIELWDDRCIQVEPNTGRCADGIPRRPRRKVVVQQQGERWFVLDERTGANMTFSNGHATEDQARNTVADEPDWKLGPAVQVIEAPAKRTGCDHGYSFSERCPKCAEVMHPSAFPGNPRQG